MRRRLEELLRSPCCLATLRVHAARTGVTPQGEPEVLEGTLECDTCRRAYPILDGIPRMIGTAASPSTSLAEVKTRTAALFGHEWTRNDRHGFDDPDWNVDREATVFRRKSTFAPEEIAGRLTLDAGCGNGRYSFQAARAGAEVIAVDLGAGVGSTRRNNRASGRVHVVQADLHRLPFASGTFDRAFSIGVLMHTGDARRAFDSIARTLAPGGEFGVRLYGRGNPLYEFHDRWIRAVTTRCPPPALEELSRVGAAVAAYMRRLGLLRFANAALRLEAHPVLVFDWYGAPVATHHTYGEIEGWVRTAGVELVLDYRDRRRRLLPRHLIRPPTVTFRVRRPASA